MAILDAAIPTPAREKIAEQMQNKRTDKHIWGIYFALCFVSIVELYSASAHEVNGINVISPVIRHLIFLFMGLGIMLYLQNTHYRKFLSSSYIFAALSFIAMVYTLIWGDYINGARRSFSIMGFFAVQPAEMVKISAALMIAAILSKSQMSKEGDVTGKGLAYVLAVVLLAGGLLFFQGLTNTLLLMGISFSMMLIGGVSFNKLIKVLGVFMLVGLLGVGVKLLMGNKEVVDTSNHTTMVVPGTNVEVGIDDATSDGGGKFRFETWKNRIMRFMKGDKHLEPINNLNQQEQYSYIAQAHGGIAGVLPGNSRETARLPLAFSDYIYAIIIEELGLLGGILVLALYLWLLARAGIVASRCQSAYPALLVIGMAVYITFQAMFHMAIVTGVFPVSGQPLPLISKGGTSILITSLALGVMLSVSRFAARKGQRSEIKEELKALPDEVNAVNPT